jgi:CheY-like chemotaxis protein
MSLLQVHKKYVDNSRNFNMYSPKNKVDGRFIEMNSIDNLFQDYTTADILLVDDDPIVTYMFKNKIKKMIIKRDKDDLGRPVKLVTFNNSKNLLSDILEYKSTYGLILIDENLGPDNFSGSQCIRRLRKKGYTNPIVSISGSFKPKDIKETIRKSGADGFLPKSPSFFSEIHKFLFKLTKRDLDQN